MKTVAFFLTLAMSTSLMAKTVVKIPLFVELEEERKSIPVSELNEKFKLTGKNKLLEVLIVDESIESRRLANKTYWAENAKADELSAKLDVAFHMELTSLGNGQCYSGSPAAAVNILETLADGPFSDQLVVSGWKYKKEVHILGSQDEEETIKYLNEGSPLWKKWVGYNETILTISHETDSGDDIIEGLITKCE